MLTPGRGAAFCNIASLFVQIAGEFKTLDVAGGATSLAKATPDVLI
jgi:hypothetical protein